MTARYLVRLDDACPTMHRSRWDAIEALLDDLEVRPIVGVIPDNGDPELVLSPADPEFWNRVRRWREKGWSIAMHGLHHVYHQVERRRLLVPLHDRSEFAGLDPEVQARLIARSWSIFDEQGVHPTAWIAPAHAFDRFTIEALRSETPIRIISDGLSRGHFCQDGFTWVPQQLWQPERRKSGIWTICLHPNTMDEQQLHRLATHLSEPFYRKRTVGLSDLVLHKRGKSILDRLYPHYFFGRRRAIEAILPSYQSIKRLRARLAMS